MKIREIELPGIGKKYEIITKNEEKTVIIIHDDGRRDIYFFDQDDHEEAAASTTLTDSEARQIAGIIGGMTYSPKALETIEIAFDDLVIEWYKLEPGSKAVNRSIGDLKIRENYQVTIVALIKKNHQKINTPGPDTILEAGDTLVVSGHRNQLKIIIKELLARRDG